MYHQKDSLNTYLMIINNDKKYPPINKGGKLPLYGWAFDKMNMTVKRILGQEDYADFWECEARDTGFWKHYMTQTDLKINLTTAVRAWKSRAVRNYCSLLREYHLYTLLIDLEKQYSISVLYKRYYDAQGYDFIIESPVGTLGIRSYVATARSFEQLNRKEQENQSRLFLPCVDLTIDPFDKSRQVNGFTLHIKEDLAGVEKLISKIV